MGTVTERLALLVEANAGQAIASFKQVGAAAKGLAGDVGKAGGVAQSLGGTLSGIFGATGGLLGTAGLAAAGTAIAKFTTGGIADFVALGDEVKQFQQIAGGTTETASLVVAAGSAVGLSVDTLANGVFQLEKHVASSSDKLEAMGVTIVKDSKGNVDMTATLLSVGDAYKRMTDPAQRALLLTDAFGKSGAALVPLLAKPTADIKAMFAEAGKDHAILSAKDVADVTAYNLAVHDLKESMTGLEIEAGKTLVPFLTDIAGAITDTVHLTDQIGGLIGKLGVLDTASSIDKALGTNKVHVNPLAVLPSILEDIFGKGKPAADTVRDLGDGLLGVNNAIALVAADTTGMDDLDKALSSATDADRSLADAQHQVTDAQAALNTLLRTGAVDLKAVAAAQVSLADATRGVGHAQREQAKAQGDYNDAAAAAAILGTDTAGAAKQDAANKLADANDNVASAQERAAKAAADLKAAQAGDPDYQLKLADARQKVADATYTESQKALASVDAHDKETTALNDNAGAVQALFDKYKALIAQHPDVALALAGNLAALGPALPAPAGPPPVPGGLPGMPVNDAWKGGAGPAPGTTVNNVTVNVPQGTPISPTGLARTIIWNLN